MWERPAADAVLGRLAQDVTGILRDADMTGAVAVRVIDAPELPAFGWRADEAFPAASLYKLVVMVAFCRAVDRGDLDPTAFVTLRPEDRADGPTGLAICQDPVRISWRDLVRLMMTVSDNAAGQAVLREVGHARVRDVLREMGLSSTVVRPGPAPDAVPEQAVSVGTEQAQDPYLVPDPVGYDPLLVSATTASDLVALLCAIWQDRAASTAQCAFMRAVMSQQAWGHRFAEAFSYPGAGVAAKTGSFGALCHEAGVISHPGEKSIAVAVLTRSVRRERQIAVSNRIVGQIARHCVRSYRQFL